MSVRSFGLISLKSGTTCLKHLHLNMEMEPDDQEKDEYLPDLPDEVSGKQLVLQQCVFRGNEVFVKTHNDILKWLNSPPEFRVYPADAHKNKTTYRKKALMCSYDSQKGIMYKKIKNSDGIGKWNFHLVHESVSEISI